MSDLVAIAYEDLATAREVVGQLASLRAGDLDLDDCVIVERRDDGSIKLHQPTLTAFGAVGGAAWGGLIGLIFFMPLLGAAIGATTGAATGALLERDTGINDDFMRRMGEELQPGKAAVFMLVRKAVPANVLPTLSGRGVLIQTTLSSEEEATLRAALHSES
jgi:uncharacterized membrane protein